MMRHSYRGVWLAVAGALLLAGCGGNQVPPAATSVPTAVPAATASPTAIPPTAPPEPTATLEATLTPAPCTVTAEADATLYQRPSTEAGQFGVLAAGESFQATARAEGGWLGFEPGVAQAANVGVFRLRWVGPDAAVARAGDCAALPPAPPVSPTACYFMAMADTALYAAPDAGSDVVATMPAGGYAAAVGQSPTGWYRLDLSDGSPAGSGTGWLNPNEGNFNGPCDSLPAVTP